MGISDEKQRDILLEIIRRYNAYDKNHEYLPLSELYYNVILIVLKRDLMVSDMINSVKKDLESFLNNYDPKIDDVIFFLRNNEHSKDKSDFGPINEIIEEDEEDKLKEDEDKYSIYIFKKNIVFIRENNLELIKKLLNTKKLIETDYINLDGNKIEFIKELLKTIDLRRYDNMTKNSIINNIINLYNLCDTKDDEEDNIFFNKIPFDKQFIEHVKKTKEENRLYHKQVHEEYMMNKELEEYNKQLKSNLESNDEPILLTGSVIKEMEEEDIKIQPLNLSNYNINVNNVKEDVENKEDLYRKLICSKMICIYKLDGKYSKIVLNDMKIIKEFCVMNEHININFVDELIYFDKEYYNNTIDYLLNLLDNGDDTKYIYELLNKLKEKYLDEIDLNLSNNNYDDSYIDNINKNIKSINSEVKDIIDIFMEEVDENEEDYLDDDYIINFINNIYDNVDLLVSTTYGYYNMYDGNIVEDSNFNVLVDDSNYDNFDKEVNTINNFVENNKKVLLKKFMDTYNMRYRYNKLDVLLEKFKNSGNYVQYNIIINYYRIFSNYKSDLKEFSDVIDILKPILKEEINDYKELNDNKKIKYMIGCFMSNIYI